MNKKISIVIPSYNSEKTIGRALNSIVNQSYSNYEVVLVDGGSSDATIEVFQKYFPDFRYISEPDAGVADALNKGFSMCSGDYLCWLNSDDQYCSENALLNLATAITNNCDWVVGHSVVYDLIKERRKYLAAWIPNNAYYMGTNLFTGSLLFKRACWINFNGFTVSYKVAFEYELTKFLIENFNGSVCQTVCAQFNLSNSSLSFLHSRLMVEEKKNIYNNSSIPEGFHKRIAQISAYVRQRSLLSFIVFWYRTLLQR